MREMELTQAYRHPRVGGFEDLRSWAYARLDGIKSRDTLSRLCSATLNLILPLDAQPIITEDGEKINGLALLVSSSASSLMKLSGMFVDADSNQQRELVAGLLTGTSNANQIKQRIGWQPRIGKATAVFHELDEADENGEPLVDIHIRATYAQSKVIENNLRNFLEIHFTERGS